MLISTFITRNLYNGSFHQVGYSKKSNNHVNHSFTTFISTQKKNPLKRDHALNDATSGQMGEELKPEPSPDPLPDPDQSIGE
jgi:hypothetical protein